MTAAYAEDPVARESPASRRLEVTQPDQCRGGQDEEQRHEREESEWVRGGMLLTDRYRRPTSRLISSHRTVRWQELIPKLLPYY